MELQQNEWNKFHEDGRRYMEIVKNAVRKDSGFNPGTLYNIACMGIEKLFMAYFLKNQKMPYNHTLYDLVYSFKEDCSMPADLEKKLLYMNEFQEICSIEQYTRKDPTKEDIEAFIDTLNLTYAYLYGFLQ